MRAEDLLDEALQLPAGERAELLQGLVRSLEYPEAYVDAMWIAEADQRLKAYRAGKLKTVSAEEALSG